MLVLRRRTDEELVLTRGNEEIVIKLVEVSGGYVRLGLDLARSWTVTRRGGKGELPPVFRQARVAVRNNPADPGPPAHPPGCPCGKCEHERAQAPPPVVPDALGGVEEED